jgi:hypothetical protein
MGADLECTIQRGDDLGPLPLRPHQDHRLQRWEAHHMSVDRDLIALIDRGVVSAGTAYRFAASSYTYEALNNAHAVKRYVLAQPDWIAEFEAWHQTNKGRKPGSSRPSTQARSAYVCDDVIERASVVAHASSRCKRPPEKPGLRGRCAALIVAPFRVANRGSRQRMPGR